MTAPKSFALVLGGGGARGLAQIPVLEALDELGARPALIAGSSIGAAIGAAYAAGLSGKDIRRHTIALMHDRAEVWRRLMSARSGALANLLAFGLGNPMLLDAEKLCEAFLPARIPRSFEELQTPLIVMASDLYGRCERMFDSGALRPPLAASLAIPGLLRPVEIEGRVLVDGAAVNPLPFDQARGRADLVIAVDTSIGPMAPRGVPDPWEALFSTIQLMGQTIVTEKLKHGAPALVIRPNVSGFRLLEFLKVSAILRLADAARTETKRQLAAVLGA